MSDNYVKAVNYVTFVAEWTKAVETDNSTQFMSFRWDYAVLGAYVLTHAYNLWSTNYDKWDNVGAFALNYVKVVEAGETRIMDKWVDHGQLVRSLIMG